MTEIRTNGLRLTAWEREATARAARRLRAETMSLYRMSTGLYAYVVDEGGGEHVGVRISA
jgi:hypothetical protein